MCKGRLGSRGGGGGRGCIRESRHQSSDKIDHFARWTFLLFINCINIYNILYRDKCRTIVYLSLMVYFPHMLLNSEHS